MRILVGCSGGLDSTFAARLLSEHHEVCGASLKMNRYTDTGAAKEACDSLGIPFVEIDARDLFEQCVVENFVNEYSRARTPNPCVVCNRYVKFALLCDYARKNGFDRVATGHYCSVEMVNGRYCIVRAADERKDQSYMLWPLTQDQLSMLQLPLADAIKDDVRQAALGEGIKAAEQKESQDICFIPDGDYISFIEARRGKFPEGNFVDKQGNVLGKHKGIINYTVGQRKGLGIALGQPMFVTAIDAERNTVTLAPAGGEFSDCVSVSGLSFQALEGKDGIYDNLTVKIRYAAKPVPCKVIINNGHADVEFFTPQRAVTPGQSAVFYEGNKVAFGGFID